MIMSRSYKKEFQKWAVGRSHILNELEGCPLKAGDKVTFTNTFGVEFPHREVMGIQATDFTKQQFPSCNEIRVYLDYDCYWLPARISSLTKE